jgi:hypothetical protein
MISERSRCVAEREKQNDVVASSILGGLSLLFTVVERNVGGRSDPSSRL